MGNWHISIEGQGALSYLLDANRMVGEFVEKMRAAGHTISRATFTHGGAERLIEDGPEVRSGLTPMPTEGDSK